MSEHHHDHGDERFQSGIDRSRNGQKQMVKVKAKHAPGAIGIKRQIHDGAVVISGSLVVDFDNANISASIEQELEAASREVSAQGGIVGHIKAGVKVFSTSMTSVTYEKATTAESPLKRAKITLAAIVFNIGPETAEDIVRNVLASVRSGLQPDRQIPHSL